MMGRRRTRGPNAQTNNISYQESLSSNKTPTSSTKFSSGSQGETSGEYPIKCILEESHRRYLISWEGPYQPTWEPKHFVNKAAVRAWERKKNKRLAAFRHYQNSRPSRRRVQQDSEFGFSGHSTAPSTIPASQLTTTTTTSGEPPASDSTQRSIREGLSQSSSLSGSVFLPETQSGRSLVSGGSFSQSQHSFSPSANPGSRLTSQEFSQTTFGLISSFQSLSSGSSIVSSTVGIIALSNSQPSSSIVQGTQTQETAFVHLESSPFPVPRRGNIARYYRSAQQLLSEGDGVPSNHQSREVEVEETPQSRLLGAEPEDPNSKHSQDLISEIDNPSGSASTPSRPPSGNPVPVQTVPETVYHRRSIPGATLRLSRSQSDPENLSPVVAVPEPRRRHSLTQKTTLTGSSYCLRPEDDSLLQPLPQLSQLESTPGVAETMDDPSSNNNTPNRRNIASDSARSTVGQSLKDRLGALRRVEQEAVQPLQSVSGSATPSSAGDIEPTAAPANPPTASPLSVRIDKEHPIHEMSTEPARSSPVPPFVAPQALHYDVEHPDIVPGLVKEPGPGLVDVSELGLPSTALVDTVDKDDGNYERSASPEIKGVRLTPFEFAIPLPMDSRVKDDYDKILDGEAKTITKFLEVSDREALIESEGYSIISRLRKMVDQLGNVCTHPDLNLEDPPPTNVNDIAREASWAEYSSSKFLFLGYFIDAADAAQDHDLHVIVMVKNARTAKTMETYFLGKGFSLRINPSQNPDESEMILYRGSLSFGIRTTSDSRLTESFKTPSLLIALDNSFNVESESARQLRATRIPDQLIPVVRLVIANSAEHLQLCLPDCSDLVKLRLLVKYANIYCDNAGELQDNALGVQEDAEEILTYLTAEPPFEKWPLPMIEALDIKAPEEAPSNPEPEDLRSMTSSGQKRWLEGEEDDNINPTKRQRMTPLQDITHISDSVKGQTQEPSVEMQAPEEVRSEVSNEELVKEVERLRSALDETRERLKNTETGFASLQYRFETKHKQLHKTRQDLDSALEGAKKSTNRIEKQKDEILKLKEEKSGISKELEEARNIIKEGGGTPAELEKSQGDSRRLVAENEKLQRTVQQERSQSEYTREQYQNASSAGAQSALELRDAEKQIEELKHKASDEARRLKELRLQNDAKIHLERIDELERTLASRETLLAKKEEEIDEMKKNRHATRSTSMQPRSPKWGPSRPASPGPNSTNLSAPRGNSALRFRAEA